MVQTTTTFLGDANPLLATLDKINKHLDGMGSNAKKVADTSKISFEKSFREISRTATELGNKSRMALKMIFTAFEKDSSTKKAFGNLEASLKKLEHTAINVLGPSFNKAFDSINKIVTGVCKAIGSLDQGTKDFLATASLIAMGGMAAFAVGGPILSGISSAIALFKTLGITMLGALAPALVAALSLGVALTIVGQIKDKKSWLAKTTGRMTDVSTALLTGEQAGGKQEEYTPLEKISGISRLKAAKSAWEATGESNKQIGPSTNTLLDDFKSGVKTLGIDIDGLLPKISNWGDEITEAGKSLDLKKTYDDMRKSFGGLRPTLESINAETDELTRSMAEATEAEEAYGAASKQAAINMVEQALEAEERKFAIAEEWARKTEEMNLAISEQQTEILRKGADNASTILNSMGGNFSKLGSIIQGFAQGGIIGGIAAIIGAVIEFSKVLGNLGNMLGKVFKACGPILDFIVRGIEPILEVITNLLKGVGKALQALEPAFETFDDLINSIVDLFCNVLGEVFSVIEYICKIVSYIIRVVLAAATLGLSEVARKKKKEREASIKEHFGSSGDIRQYFISALQTTLDKAIKEGDVVAQDKIKALMTSFGWLGNETDKTAKAMQELEESFTNIPEGYKIAKAIYGAQDAVDMSIYGPAENSHGIGHTGATNPQATVGNAWSTIGTVNTLNVYGAADAKALSVALLDKIAWGNYSSTGNTATAPGMAGVG